VTAYTVSPDMQSTVILRVTLLHSVTLDCNCISIQFLRHEHNGASHQEGNIYRLKVCYRQTGGKEGICGKKWDQKL